MSYALLFLPVKLPWCAMNFYVIGRNSADRNKTKSALEIEVTSPNMLVKPKSQYACKAILGTITSSAHYPL